MMGAMASPFPGTDGNVEFLLHLRADGDAAPDCPPKRSALVDAAVAEAEAAPRLREG